MNKNVSAIERDSNQYNEMLKQFAVSALILCTSQQLFCLFLLDFRSAQTLWHYFFSFYCLIPIFQLYHGENN